MQPNKNYFVFLIIMMEESVYYNSPIGVLQIKSSGDAISCVSFLSNEHPQPAPNVSFTKPSSKTIKDCIRQLDEYFAGKRFDFELELNQPGTDFQQQVWNALLDIKFGKTSSYLALSRRLGNEKAIRAVGTANGRNNIAIIVPCHRVIGTNGKLVGYGGGLWRKQWLLEHEGKFANGVQSLF